MWSATLRFYAELNDFLPLSQRYDDNPVEVQQGAKVRQLILLLTRDRALLMRREITHGCYIRSQKHQEQVAVVMQHCDLMKWLNACGNPVELGNVFP